jgi:hypothetical protein
MQSYADRLVQLVIREEKPPWFPLNTIGKPKGAWPTFVSFPGTHAFQGDGPGLVYRHALAIWDEPSPKKEKGLWGSKLALLVTSR